MDSQIFSIAALAEVDAELDELHEELGDLPQEVKEAEKRVRQRMNLVDETQGLLNELLEFKSNSGITLQELKDKETKYGEQQFQVRNNREFDAITNEISGLRKLREEINDKLRTTAVKEENLNSILLQQQKDLEEAQSILLEREKKLNEVSGAHNQEVKRLLHSRTETSENINNDYFEEYERIRTFHSDAAVRLRKNCCSGCFSAVPPQKIVEMRNNLNQMYTCENCGRILIPEKSV